MPAATEAADTQPRVLVDASPPSGLLCVPYIFTLNNVSRLSPADAVSRML